MDAYIENDVRYKFVVEQHAQAVERAGMYKDLIDHKCETGQPITGDTIERFVESKIYAFDLSRTLTETVSTIIDEQKAKESAEKPFWKRFF